MAPLWNRIPLWADWVAAMIAAVVVLNVDVTSAGDPLSGLTDGARTLLYATLAVGGLVLTAAGMILSASSSGSHPLGGFVVRTYSCVSLAGLLGLLLDYRDGPGRTVQLVVYLMLALGAVRLVRVSAAKGPHRRRVRSARRRDRRWCKASVATSPGFLGLALRRVHRSGAQITVASPDLDGVKSVADTHGTKQVTPCSAPRPPGSRQ